MTDVDRWTIWHTPGLEPGTHKSYVDGPPAGDWAGKGVKVIPATVALENERLRSALAKADAEVAVLADALRETGMAPMMVQAIIDSATPRGKVAT